jgi:seryl-tRNA synthetase
VWAPERVVRTLRERGELWEAAPGLVGLRGDALALLRALEEAVAALARAETEDEWRVPAGVGWETLARAEYLASFPQWLTAASHLSDDPAALERIATHSDPAAAAREAQGAPPAALPPAVCYHTYAVLAGRTVVSPTRMTAQGTCWRHEGERLRPLERGWAFTMREVVCLGTPEETEAFRQRTLGEARALARALGLRPEVEQAADPFFAPTARGRALLQRIKALKHELVLPLGGGRGIAASSFNHHETFFGEAFDIRLPDGRPASTACAAFGMERWLLAFLVEHGPDAAGWPAVTSHTLHAER